MLLGNTGAGAGWSGGTGVAEGVAGADAGRPVGTPVEAGAAGRIFRGDNQMEAGGGCAYARGGELRPTSEGIT